MPETLNDLYDIYQQAHYQFTEAAMYENTVHLNFKSTIETLQNGLNQVHNADEFNQIIKHITNVKYIREKLAIHNIYFDIIKATEELNVLGFSQDVDDSKNKLFQKIDALQINQTWQNHLKTIINYRNLNQIVLGLSGVYYDEDHPDKGPLDITTLSYKQLKQLYKLNEDIYQSYLTGNESMYDYVEDNDRVEKQKTLKWLALILNQLRKMNRQVDTQYLKNAHGLSKRADINGDLSINFDLEILNQKGSA